LKKQYGEKTLSNVSAYKWSGVFKKERETVENEPHERQPRNSVTGKNSDRVDALIQENRQIGTSVSQTREIMLKSNNFSFRE
jgi:hypothetical protein